MNKMDGPKDDEIKVNNSMETQSSKSKQKARPKRKPNGLQTAPNMEEAELKFHKYFVESETSSDAEDELPENMLETEKNLHASAVKNNLDEISVRKILKRVVTNDHVLALVKLREEEENEMDTEVGNRPTKLTRSKVKELMKVSPKTATWNLELTPIKHIPVKTRPEVNLLIAQDLPDDEDDDEYEPTNDEVPSDDDQTVESSSDLESQPRTPATPQNHQTASPKVVTDGPFKVPQTITATKRKLVLEEEEATIARRTRSKLSLSATSIEHIESTFVPPDDIPVPDVDDLWNQFLSECLNPASTSKHEDDDEADPEYNVAADPDALEEDEDNLSKSIIKISKKELNDLVTELFAIMPDAACDDLAENLANSMLTDNSPEISRCEGKQEILSDEETQTVTDKLQEKNKPLRRFSVGKSEPAETEPECHNETLTAEVDKEGKVDKMVDKMQSLEEVMVIEIKEETDVNEEVSASQPPQQTEVAEKASQPEDQAPPLLRQFIEQQANPEVEVLEVRVHPGKTVLPEQVLIFQQQLRQHIQLATTNFLQLYVHPIHWSYAPAYKEYVQSFCKMVESNPDTLANVCNLKSAYELICSWESTVADATPENEEMVRFINIQNDRYRRRNLHTSVPVIDLPERIKQVVSNSGVFLYPHLLPPTAYRPDHTKRFSYVYPEDQLIALGLQEFWDYVDMNPSVFKPRPSRGGTGSHLAGGRPGLTLAAELVAKHLLPSASARAIVMHVQSVHKQGLLDNPINVFLKHNKVEPVRHTLLPFNPHMTLYEQPAHEIPRLWLKYLAKTSCRMRQYLAKESQQKIQPTSGVPVKFGQMVEVPTKKPLTIDYNHEIVSGLPKPDLSKPDDSADKANNNVLVAANVFSVVRTSTGTVLVPLSMIQNTNIVDAQKGPIMTPAEVKSNPENTPKETQSIEVIQDGEKEDHCECCVILRRITKKKQRVITDYFKPRTSVEKECPCTNKKYPRVSNRLRLFLSFYNTQSQVTLSEIQERLNDLLYVQREPPDASDLEYALQFQCRLLTRIGVRCNNITIKKTCYDLFNKFDINTGDPTRLAQSIHEQAIETLDHVYNEFLGFLTAEQAENYGVFPYYFFSYMRNIMRRIDTEITDVERRKAILIHLKNIHMNAKKFTSCQICKLLLSELHGYPELAKYVFSLFPHKVCQNRGITVQPIKQVQPVKLFRFQPLNKVVAPPVNIAPEMDPKAVIEAENVSRTEVTQSAPEPEKEIQDKDVSEKQTCVVKSEPMSDDELGENSSCHFNADLNEDSGETTDGTMVIVEKDAESQDWTREEDKVLLEIIKKYLASQDKKNKSVFQILQEKGIYQLIAERLIEKSMDDIVQRVLYLLEVLVVSEK